MYYILYIVYYILYIIYYILYIIYFSVISLNYISLYFFGISYCTRNTVFWL